MNSPAYQPDAGGSRPTVLVVEDEVLIRLMIADALRREGLNVIEACTADEAISVLQSSISVRLLFTDFELPGELDGSALAAMAHKAFPALKVVVASGQPRSCFQASADAFFSKPYDPVAVARLVKQLIDESETSCQTITTDRMPKKQFS
jgi:two-component system, response regulator PdtaR